ncbi:hypothetical protein [Maribacter sp. MAR_2009_72]|uniref:hypothetical protein n=1 Tax=Maribacter sp. MAR_2009_72 TaxID=1250050 RepID=UPI00119B92DF|nr:hypothetical protein [Maribacter sp. MAR_2009_72]TVZ14555.1 hypothetical protein JM81_0760 [Maribacter sp. MAR_2009_72]
MGKKVLLAVIIVIALFVGFTYWSLSSTSKTFDTCEIVGREEMKQINFREFDSVLVAASTLYEGNTIKNIMQGEQYRKAWSTPVKVPIVFLDTLLDGVHILEEGGGHQTHSLKLKTADGTLLTLRSVSKDPSPLIPKVAESLGLENIVVDGISAQHPYAALVVAKLADAAKILNTRPQLVFVPEQEFLGNYNEKFGNRLFLLEYETEGNAQWLGINAVRTLLDTEDLQELKFEKNKNVIVDHRALVRARLFDLLIGDWDRHSKQWGWAIKDSSEMKVAIPMPCDRDNAFFNLEGVLPTLISNNTFLPEVQSFESDIDFLEGLVSPFDIYFMKDFDENIFKVEARELQVLLSDEEITKAFAVWPKEIRELDADNLIGKIKQRRNDLVTYAKEFHDVVASAEPVTEPLNGSEDLKLNDTQLTCFSCSGNYNNER